MKAPKLRFKPNEYLREKGTKQLYQILYCYRLKKEPHVWRFHMEEREQVGQQTPLLGRVLEAQALNEGRAGEQSGQRVFYDLVWDRNEIDQKFNWMWRSNSIDRTNKELLNDFEVVQ